MNAGADTTTAIRSRDEKGRVISKLTPLAYADLWLSGVAKDLSESQLASIADEGGGRSCSLLAVGKQPPPRHPRC